MVMMATIATKSRIYLDHAATTPAWPPAIAAMADAATLIGNPASVHGDGRNANAVVEQARDAVAAWAGVAPASVVFTSGGTESIALAMNGCGQPRALAMATEHSAALQARTDVAIIPVDGSGLIDLGALEQMLAGAPAIVAVQAGNNETGVIQPLAEVAALVAAAGGQLLADCVQSAGKLALPAADFIALSGHKLGAPPGIGVLIVADPGQLAAIQRGGQERGLRGGTPNLPGIAAFGAALARPADWATVAARRARLEAALQAEGAIIHGAAAPRLPHISNVGLPGVKAGTQVMALDLAGFSVSAGAACSSGKVAASHVLAAMGLGAAAGEAIRISLGPDTSDANVDAFIAAWRAMAARLRA
jgi:cysteine desulfurase